MRQLKRRDLAIGVKFPQPCQTCDALIIDEVSMLTAKTLDLAADVMLGFRKKLPQLVVSGDPMQLQAVEQRERGAARRVDRRAAHHLRRGTRRAERRARGGRRLRAARVPRPRGVAAGGDAVQRKR